MMTDLFSSKDTHTLSLSPHLFYYYYYFAQEAAETLAKLASKISVDSNDDENDASS